MCKVWCKVPRRMRWLVAAYAVLLVASIWLAFGHRGLTIWEDGSWAVGQVQVESHWDSNGEFHPAEWQLSGCLPLGDCND